MSVVTTEVKEERFIDIINNHDNIYLNSQSEIGTVSIYDFSGKLLYNNPANSKQVTISTTKFPQGLYILFVQYTDGALSETRKIFLYR